MNESKEAITKIPLHYFDSEEKLVKLDDCVSIRVLGPGEMKSLTDTNPGFFGKMLDFVHFEVSHVIENRTASKDPWKRADDVILALRLLKRGEIKISTAFIQNGPSIGIMYNPIGLAHRTRYHLKSEDVKNLKTLWSRMMESPEKPYLNFSIHNFMSSYDKLSYIDRIVDFMTAFESLIFHEEREALQPAGKIMGIGIGIMLGKSQKERDRIKAALTEAYTVRSHRVHGNAKQLSKLDNSHIEQLAIEIEEYLRCALRKLIEE